MVTILFIEFCMSKIYQGQHAYISHQLKLTVNSAVILQGVRMHSPTLNFKWYFKFFKKKQKGVSSIKSKIK